LLCLAPRHSLRISNCWSIVVGIIRALVGSPSGLFGCLLGRLLGSRRWAHHGVYRREPSVERCRGRRRPRPGRRSNSCGTTIRE
jgi:hypothetical protein